MTEKELRKLSRADLLEMLIEQSKEVEQLKDRLKTAERALHERRIKIEEAGSIAEAALKLNDVFEAADAAGKQYLENLQGGRKTAAETAEERDARRKTAAYLTKALKRCREIEAETRRICEDMIEKARENPAVYEKIYGSAAGEKTESCKGRKKGKKEKRNPGDTGTSGRTGEGAPQAAVFRYISECRRYIGSRCSFFNTGRNVVDAGDEDIRNVYGAYTERRTDRRGRKRFRVSQRRSDCILYRQ